MHKDINKLILPKEWLNSQKQPLACKEKIKLLNENILEIFQLAEEIIDESILMGVDPKQTKLVIKNALSNLNSSLKK